MDAASIPVLQGGPYDDLPDVMEAIVPPASAIPTSSGHLAVQREAWQRLLKAEDEVIAADWECRGVIYNEHILAVDEFVADFEERCAADLAGVSDAWDRVVTEAEKLGFTGQTGPLGR